MGERRLFTLYTFFEGKDTKPPCLSTRRLCWSSDRGSNLVCFQLDSLFIRSICSFGPEAYYRSAMTDLVVSIAPVTEAVLATAAALTALAVAADNAAAFAALAASLASR